MLPFRQLSTGLMNLSTLSEISQRIERSARIVNKYLQKQKIESKGGKPKTKGNFNLLKTMRYLVLT